MALCEANWTCAACGSESELHVHHTSYERLGNEADDDLQVLCASCHHDTHNPMPCRHCNGDDCCLWCDGSGYETPLSVLIREPD